MASITAAAPQFLVAKLHRELVGRGARITKPLELMPWGTRDFHVEDPDGYILCFSELLPR